MRGHEAMMLSDVCLSVAYIGPKSRTERPMKTKIGTEVAHVTRDSDTTFKVTRPLSHRRQAAAAVGVGTCWPWETVATLPSDRRRKALRRPRGRRGVGHIVYCIWPPAYSLFLKSFKINNMWIIIRTCLNYQKMCWPCCPKQTGQKTSTRLVERWFVNCYYF